MIRRTLIQSMLRVSQRLKHLPASKDARGLYRSADLSGVLGRRPTTHDARVLELLGWTRKVRKINGTTQRVWFPPGKQSAPIDDLRVVSLNTTSTSRITKVKAMNNT